MQTTQDMLPVPPADLSICFGGGDYVESGRMLLDFYIRHAGLTPRDHVLDVGCGVGRAAYALTGFLGPEARYCGFDTYPFGVDWCQENITPRFPNFRFELVDVYSGVYNPFGNTQASAFRFPHPDDSFDLVVLTSVFTHMLPADMANYLAEIARVLRPGGRMFATYYLMNDEVRALLREHESNPTFRRSYGGFHVANPEEKEEAVAYEESLVRNMLAQCGLGVAQVCRGGWCGRGGAENGQDMLVAVKALPE
jgi:SAM-dependent methyltransferase